MHLSLSCHQWGKAKCHSKEKPPTQIFWERGKRLYAVAQSVELETLLGVRLQENSKELVQDSFEVDQNRQ